ncbi:MAG: FAD-dependent oxidoreductase [Actinobacteria bacterium]|nr:FAD-dependent oxidoreductase [Actinomycetota bacterium]
MLAAATRPVWHDAVAVAETHAGWQVQHAPSSIDVDVAIIGGGLSGLWTAYYLSSLLPAASIAVVEARRVGFGASGRNGGWCSGFFPLTPSELAEQFGAQAGLAAYHESFRTLDEIERVLTAERIDCAWHRGGTIQSASTALQAERLQALVAAQHAAGLTATDLQWLPAARVGEHLRLAETHGAVYSPHCATVNPFALVLGLTRVLRDRGVRIFEESAVHSMIDGVVSHAHGSLRANLVVHATEGYSNSFAQTKRRLAPLYSLMVATEPLSDAVVSQLGWHGRATFNDGGQMIIYAQLTADRRIAFGGRGAPYHFASRIEERFDIDDPTHQRIVASIAKHFPAAAGARITHRWGGPLGVPRDWTPSVTIDRRAKYARLGGYVGDGVAATNLFARMLVDAWHERGTALARLPFVQHASPKWEVEPFRFIGINALLKLSDSIDRYEARRGKPPRVRTKIFESLL